MAHVRHILPARMGYEMLMSYSYDLPNFIYYLHVQNNTQQISCFIE